ncbi:hypothetical protein BS47DRAFT_1356246, partial [Hydnum rufescens UP504]
MDRFPDPAVRDPPAFSSFNATTGPFLEDTIDRRNGMHITTAIDTFERAYKPQREARETTHKRQVEEEDEPD